MSIKPNTEFAGSNKEQRLELIKVLNNAGIHEYRENYYSKPKYSAQQQLKGKSHYVDDDALSYFDAKVLDCGPILDGLFFYIRESKSNGLDHVERIHSYVYFDIWGNIVDEMFALSKEDECYSTKQLDKSEQAYFKVDVVKYYKEMLIRWSGIKAKQVADYREATDAVSKMQTAELV